ncbi:hypothetical protein IWQ51_004176 [Labrenzia sp. EL_142]|nr:hypothetical protein [Labrenzia sp. EL_142]
MSLMNVQPQIDTKMIAPELSAPGANMPGAGSLASINRFEAALKDAESAVSVQAITHTNAAPPNSFLLAQTDQITAPASSSPSRTYGEIDLDATSRGLRSEAPELQIGEPSATSRVERDNRGEAILDGLSSLRSAFDAQAARVSEIATGPASISEKLVQTQVEIVRYSLLMDVSSKLTGKSTQAFDTLLKGQ